MTRTICRLVLALSLTVVSSTVRAATTWVQIDSPHFTFISSDNEGRTRDIAGQFEQIRSVVATLWPWAAVETDRPVMVFCVADDDGIKRLAPPDWKPGDAVRLTSIFEQGPDRYYIGLRSDAQRGNQVGINPYYDAYWSYVGLVVSSSLHAPLPTWLVSGISGVMANTLVQANEVQIGRVLPAHLRTLRQSSRLPLRELIVADGRSPAVTDPTRLYAFQAQSTVLLHMLLFGDDRNQRASHADAFIKHLIDGEAARSAFEESFGSPDALETEFAQYFTRPILTFRRLPADLRVRPERWPARRLTAAEAATMLAAYHVAGRRFTDAATEIRQARDADSALASTDEVEALLLDRTNEPEKARAAFEKVAEAGAASFYTYYRAAQFLSSRDQAAPNRTRMEMLLERAVALNGSYAPAYSMLSGVKVDLGKSAEAVELAQKAVGLTPNDFSAHFALARALATTGRAADAIRETRGAATAASNDAQRQAAANLRQQITAAAIGRLPPLPKSTPPPADAARVGGAIKPPVKTKDVRVTYPDLAAAAEVQGVVILEALIGADGKVVQATILRSIPLLDAAAIDAVRQWEYQPTLVDGVAVPLIYTVTVNFSLQ